VTGYEITWIPLDQLRPAPWNFNRVPPTTLEKTRQSILTFGIVENLVVRPLHMHTIGAGDYTDIPTTQQPPPPTEKTIYEVISGNHRLTLYRELAHDPAPCTILNLDNAHATLLAENLNHVRGTNDPDAYNTAIRTALDTLTSDTVTSLINETKTTIDKILGKDTGLDGNSRPKAWASRYRHRMRRRSRATNPLRRTHPTRPHRPHPHHVNDSQGHQTKTASAVP
jgi:hypothetical protein